MWTSLRSENHTNSTRGVGFWCWLLASCGLVWVGCVIGVIPSLAQSPQESPQGFDSSISPNQPLSAQDHQLPSPIPATPSAHEAGTLLVHNALRQAVWGPPMSCRIRQRTTLLDKQLISYGSYIHAGQGSGQLKMHVRLATEKRINTLLQVSDGRVMYATQHIGNTVQRSRVDLYRIREYLGPITTASLEDPVIAMYLAVGGQAELLRNLAQQYRWTHVQAGKLNGAGVWLLTGELATEPPPVRASAEVDQLLFRPNHSKLLPTKVRIALGKGEPFPLWLYQVEQAREECLVGMKSNTRLSMLLEFFEPTELTSIAPEMFRSDASEEAIVEETRRYLPPTPVVAQLPGENNLK